MDLAACFAVEGEAAGLARVELQRQRRDLGGSHLAAPELDGCMAARLAADVVEPRARRNALDGDVGAAAGRRPDPVAGERQLDALPGFARQGDGEIGAAGELHAGELRPRREIDDPALERAVCKPGVEAEADSAVERSAGRGEMQLCELQHRVALAQGEFPAEHPVELAGAERSVEPSARRCRGERQSEVQPIELALPGDDTVAVEDGLHAWRIERTLDICLEPDPAGHRCTERRRENAYRRYVELERGAQLSLSGELARCRKRDVRAGESELFQHDAAILSAPRGAINFEPSAKQRIGGIAQRQRRQPTRQGRGNGAVGDRASSKVQPAAAAQRLPRKLGELREIGNLQPRVAVNRRAVPSYCRARGEDEACRCRSERLDVDGIGSGIGRARELPFPNDAKSCWNAPVRARQILDATVAGDYPTRLRPADVAVSNDVKLGVATVDAVAIGTQLP